MQTSQHYFSQSPFLSACLSIFCHACSLLYSFSQVVKYQSILCSVCSPFIRDRSFSFAAPKICNSFPPDSRMCTCPDTFHRQRKTRCIQQDSQSLGTFFLATQIRRLLTIVRVVIIFTHLLLCRQHTEVRGVGDHVCHLLF